MSSGNKNNGSAETGGQVAANAAAVQESLLRLAHMFNPHREEPLMRELARLAIKCAQERLISV